VDLEARIDEHLRVLIDGVGPRPPGSAANLRACAHLAGALRDAGLAVRELPFRASHWIPGPGRLEIGTEDASAVEPNPFSPACDVRGRVARVERREDLDGEGLHGAVLVLDGDLTREQVFPRKYPFVTFAEHVDLVEAVQRLAPAVVLAVAPHEAPFVPVFEDADLTFPSATVPPSVAEHLADGDEVRVRLEGRTIEGDGVNVSAGATGRRVVLSAHADTKVTTPGAIDNGGSVAALLALAESGVLADLDVEYVFFNGEDDYAAPGEQAWFAASDLGAVRLNVNVDGAGAAGRGTAAVALSATPELEATLADMVAERDDWSIREPWIQSDHAIFAMRGIPAVAITCEDAEALLPSLIHTAADTRDRVDTATLASVARFVADLVRRAPRLDDPPRQAARGTTLVP
jgi:aminopeptidase YwaD